MIDRKQPTDEQTWRLNAIRQRGMMYQNGYTAGQRAMIKDVFSAFGIGLILGALFVWVLARREAPR